MRIAAVQMSSQPDKAANLAQAKELIAAAVAFFLVDGLSVIDAAARAGITQQGANQAVLRCRRSMERSRNAPSDGFGKGRGERCRPGQ